MKAEEILNKLSTDGKLEGFDTRELYSFEGEQYGRENLKRLTQEMYEKKQLSGSSAMKFRMAIEEDERDKRFYPTLTRFRKSNLFRHDFYLLADEFYKMQNKILKEIQTQIEPIFEKDQHLTYDEYIAMIKNSSPQLFKEKYSNTELPGLNEQEVVNYLRYLEVNCPHMNNKDLTKKDFTAILSSITEYDTAQYPDLLGIRKIQQTDLAEQKQVESPILGQNLFPYELLSSKLNTVLSSKQLDCSGKENFEIAYQLFVKQNPKSFINEDDFTMYC